MGGRQPFICRRGETPGSGRSSEGRVGVHSPQRRERRALEGSAFQREGAGRLKCQTPAPRPPRVGGAWGGGGAAALPPRKMKERLDAQGRGGAGRRFPAALLIVREGRQGRWPTCVRSHVGFVGRHVVSFAYYTCPSNGLPPSPPPEAPPGNLLFLLSRRTAPLSTQAAWEFPGDPCVSLP